MNLTPREFAMLLAGLRLLEVHKGTLRLVPAIKALYPDGFTLDEIGTLAAKLNDVQFVQALPEIPPEPVQRGPDMPETRWNELTLAREIQHAQRLANTGEPGAALWLSQLLRERERRKQRPMSAG